MPRPDIAAIGREIQALLGISDEQIAYEWRDLSEYDVLAMCWTKPERNMAVVAVDRNCPDAEIRPSIWHELVHVLLAPITSQLSGSKSDVMIEERITEKLTLAFGKVNARDGASLSSAMRKTLPARMRARVDAAQRRERRGTMDPSMIEAAIAALAEGDGAKALEILKGILTAAASASGEPAAAREDDAPAGEDDPAMTRPEEPPPAERLSRGKMKETPDAARARRAADVLSQSAIRQRVRELRDEGIHLDAASEKALLALNDIDKAEERIGWLQRGRGAAGESRAASGARPRTTTEPGQGGGKVSREDLEKEGFSAQWIAQYEAQHKTDAGGAAAFLDGARRGRATSNGPWQKTAQPGKGN